MLRLAMALASVWFAAPARAGPAEQTAPASPQPPGQGEKAADLEARRHDYQGVQDTLAQSEAQKKKIEAEIASYQNDRAKLVSALIDAKKKIDDDEAKIAETQSRLDTLTGSETAIRRSLESRRGVLIEVLAALQRMDRKPPPALLAEPRDVLRAIRASMLLGAVLPELRSETEALANDLRDLVSLRASIARERADLARELLAQRDQRARLEALIAARQQSIGAAREALASEQAKAQALAGKASNLKDLISRMESELDSARRAADEARKADEARARLTQEQIEEAKKRFANAPQRDPARLAPAIAFADAKGMLSLPASGRIIKYFGAPSDFGGVEKGLSLATRPNAIVSAPSDGYIAFSGPWRTYGQLLIINAGDGYYVVLAGLARTDVAVGQFVLAGEPVGTMGDGTAKTAAAVAIGATQPVLYVEFRKDGTAIDPNPWWSKSEMQRVRG
ncbi:peptidoglycan DD-metalloendopeptidase family protein [Rhodoblastus acidophilus]|uniref:Peptidoglycan DD-metalloendopeptidase family protein n=1 Tax=Candidatus Rhodoblastus alkanivorans TaxID=2954117 RepID=A0ABS9Z5I2_9HYPH|nr:peptidoglycan DD-metalloendopeptidase family protein [Candidatus Rhodoblastus alkanivorans]MCI4679953.1 peptidoglycan DD-metalloendopeptidase family protein [Candidatus Rhodoblastus alkanivorans]MCI4682336.1 peptidoglycan DD-metalloendopeptidase family protein [Candidatus Rhodoblastus alkanivorans]MDI4639639.1 peptidoglycan DD-metalloendopeptidase family protein [Rhodoblastus acidophilus]